MLKPWKEIIQFDMTAGLRVPMCIREHSIETRDTYTPYIYIQYAIFVKLDASVFQQLLIESVNFNPCSYNHLVITKKLYIKLTRTPVSFSLTIFLIRDGASSTNESTMKEGMVVP